MADYQLSIRVRNGRILARMNEAGIDGLKQLAERAGMSYGALVEIVSLRKAPVKKDGEWRAGVEDIAGVLGCDPDDLFTDTQKHNAAETNRLEVSMDEPEFARLCGLAPDMDEQISHRQDSEKLLEVLTPRERRVIDSLFMGGTTLEEAAAEDAEAPDSKYPVGRERIRQIEGRAIRKMRAAAARMGMEHFGRRPRVGSLWQSTFPSRETEAGY